MDSDNNIEEKFIKSAGNKLINTKYIRWMKKMDDCIYICSMMNGCNTLNNDNLHQVCKEINNDSYNKLNKFFK